LAVRAIDAASALIVASGWPVSVKIATVPSSSRMARFPAVIAASCGAVAPTRLAIRSPWPLGVIWNSCTTPAGVT
jgi:hypothetical protein